MFALISMLFLVGVVVGTGIHTSNTQEFQWLSSIIPHFVVRRMSSESVMT